MLSHNDFYNIDHYYCINLKHRVDRKNRCVEIFNNLSIDVEFVDGVQVVSKHKITNGQLGCLLSHYNIYLDIVKNKYRTALILEDDVEFVENFVCLYDEFFKRVPKNYYILYLGGNHQHKIENISENVARIYFTLTTHSYMITYKTAKELIEFFNSISEFREPIDVYLTRIQWVKPCYCFTPKLTWQRESYSDIEHMTVDYIWCKN